MKTHCFRLRRGDDLLEKLEEFAREHHIPAAAVVSGVGCVSKARVRDASGVTVRTLDEPLEIVSLMGTLSEKRTHLHLALSRENPTTLGGNLMAGCIVHTTAEIVVLELPVVHFDTEFDPETGYDELVIRQEEQP